MLEAIAIETAAVCGREHRASRFRFVPAVGEAAVARERAMSSNAPSTDPDCVHGTSSRIPGVSISSAPDGSSTR